MNGMGTREPRKEFVNFTRGKFTIKCDPDHPEAKKVTITDDNGNVVKVIYQRQYDFIEGRLTDVERVKQELTVKGKKAQVPFWRFHFDGAMGQIVLSLGYHSGWAKMILLRLPNIDIKRAFRLDGWAFTDGSSSISVKQENNPNVDPEKGTILRYWIPKESNELPPMIPPAEGGFGDTKWDDKAQLQFLWEYIEKNILPEITLIATQGTQQGMEQYLAPDKEEAVPEQDITVPDESDDLPF